MKQNVSDALRTIAIVAVAIGILIFLYWISIQLRSITQKVNTSLTTVNILLTTVNATAMEARDASEQAKLAATEQRAYWQKTSLETYKTMASLRLTIVRADHSLNDILVPNLGTLVPKLG